MQIPRSSIVAECKGCPKTKGGSLDYCEVYPNPAYWWTNKTCPAKPGVVQTYDQKKGRAGQQHQVKKSKVSKKSASTYARLGK